jgi:leucyl aminopeptidase
VEDVKERIRTLLIDAKNRKKEVQPILQKLQSEKEALKKLPKDQQKKNEQKAPVKYKELEDMKNKLERARELTRAAAKKLITSELQSVEQELKKFYDFFECGEIPDSDCSDDSGSENEDQYKDMEENI